MSAITLKWLREYHVDAYLKLAEDGDQEAVERLHSWLADMLRAGELSSEARQLLAEMHESIGRGLSVDTSMLAKPLRGGQNKTTRDGRIMLHILMQRVAWLIGHEAAKEKGQPTRFMRQHPKPTNKQVFAATAREFNLAPATIERIYKKNNKRH